MANPIRDPNHPSDTPDAPSLRVSDLACSRGEKLLFRGLDLILEPGQAVQLVGANGRGKTTMLRTLCGLQRPAAGNVFWRGRDVHRDPDAWGGECLYLAHENALNPDLTPRENLTVLDRVMGGRAGDEAIDRALDALGAAAWADRRCRRLSAGQRRRSALARLRLTKAPLWLLDEPAGALDSDARRRLAECVVAHVRGGGMALFTTHEPLPLPGIEPRLAELPA